MKKVGIMTWIQYQNYGTALQAGALSKIIKMMGYETFNINYYPRAINDSSHYSLRGIYNKGIGIIKRTFNGQYTSEGKSQLYKRYLSANLNITEPCNTKVELADLNDRFDAFICGSDQIWSPLGFDENYFLSYVRNSNKMIAYAPSIGLTKIDNPIVRDKMKKLIGRFKHLSIREQQGAELIRRLCDKNAKVVLDPTLLLSPKEWNAFEQQAVYETSLLPNKYIICYFLGDYTQYMQKVKEISNKLHMPYFIIPQFKLQSQDEHCVPFDVGPAEFLKLWSHAAYAITDSFHGVAFSLNYNKPFSVFKRFKEDAHDNQNSRVVNILRLVNLESRILENNKQPNCFLELDFSEANNRLNELRKQSLEYLRQALSDATAEADGRIINTNDVPLCCGCGACAVVCPVSAITIKENEYGFQNRTIDDSKCIQCNKCLQTCPFYHVKALNLHNAKKLIAYKSRNEQHIKFSSSGGIAADLAEQLNRQGYKVYGASYNREMKHAEHIGIEPNATQELKAIQGSKYLQSWTAKAFFEINNLDKNEKIIYFGTPCQVAALDKLLNIRGERKNAVLVDLICHGVPSQHLWRKYLQEVEGKYKISTNPYVDFRSSQGKWHIRSIAIFDDKKRYMRNDRKDLFYIFFRNSLCDMEGCYDCPYREKSGADIRIGDYWGPRYEKNEDGVSMVIGITSKGVQLIADLSGEKEEHPLKEFWDVQSPYNRQKPLFYEALIDELKNPDRLLNEIRVKYAKGYEIREKLGNLKNKIYNLINRK